MMQNHFSVAIVVYNEEHRIERFIQSMLWCDDIIVVDKSSTDRTKEFVQKYPVTLIDAPYSDTGDEIKFAKEVAKHDWILCATASSAIDYSLVVKINSLISNKYFDYDVVELPYSMQAFGIYSPHSPWYRSHKPGLIRKSALVTSTEVHREISFSGDRVYTLNLGEGEAGYFYHLTHPTVDSFLERHIRYTKCECLKYDDRKSALLESFKEVLRAIANVLLKKRVWMLGWDGIALGIAYVSYSMLKFLFVWEKFRQQSAPVLYTSLMDRIIEDLNQLNKKSSSERNE